MAKNKAVDLGIGSYMEQVKNNIRPSESETPNSLGTSSSQKQQRPIADSESFHEPQREEHEEVKEESVIRRGRPKKSKAIVRNSQKIIKFDEVMCTEIAMIKALHKVSMQDIVYIATSRFMREYFPKGRATKEGLELLAEEMKSLYNKD